MSVETNIALPGTDNKHANRATCDYLTPQFDDIPEELKALRRWVLWVPVPRGGNPKPSKVPIQISGWGASTTNRKHWATFDAVRQAYDAAVERGYVEYREKNKPVQHRPVGGVGFVFCHDNFDADGYVYGGIDFDHIADNSGKVVSIARNAATGRLREYGKQLRSYAEKSVSGDGVHIIVKAKPLAAGITHDGVEVYTSGRYFAFTGYAIGARPIAPADTAFHALANELRAAKEAYSQSNGGGVVKAGSTAVVPWLAHGGSWTSTLKAGREAAYGEAADKDALSAGISPGWFDGLDAEQKSEAVRYAALHLAKNSNVFELTANGGDRQSYVRVGLSIARTGLADAEDIFVEAAGQAKDADDEQSLRDWFQSLGQAPHRGVTVGTLLHMATSHGAEFERWQFATAIAAAAAIGTPAGLQGREPLRGGTYTLEAAMALLNGYFFVEVGNEAGEIFRIDDDGVLTHLKREAFATLTAGIHVEIPDGRGNMRLTSAAKCWLAHPQRSKWRKVFKPGGTAAAGEYNLWRGFAVERQPGRAKTRRLLRHIHRIICCGNKEQFKYLIKWLAWITQHPDSPAGTAIVLRGEAQGSGKSTLGVVMQRIFGRHGLVVTNKDQLLGKHNDHLETAVFVQGEEVLWAGDAAAADKLKSYITSETLLIEPKFRAARQVRNHMNILMTTNHTHAVPLGVNDRRYFVLDVADNAVGDRAYFDALYRDLDDGGREQFLDFLQCVRLDGWHPRRMPKTDAAKEQARMSGDSFVQWMQASLEAGGFVRSGGWAVLDFGQTHSTTALQREYADFCNERRLRQANIIALGRYFTTVFGKGSRLPAEPRSTKRPMGYHVPDEDTLRERVDKMLGI